MNYTCVDDTGLRANSSYSSFGGLNPLSFITDDWNNTIYAGLLYPEYRQDFWHMGAVVTLLQTLAISIFNGQQINPYLFVIPVLSLIFPRGPMHFEDTDPGYHFLTFLFLSILCDYTHRFNPVATRSLWTVCFLNLLFGAFPILAPIYIGFQALIKNPNANYILTGFSSIHYLAPLLLIPLQFVELGPKGTSMISAMSEEAISARFPWFRYIIHVVEWQHTQFLGLAAHRCFQNTWYPLSFIVHILNNYWNCFDLPFSIFGRNELHPVALEPSIQESSDEEEESDDDTIIQEPLFPELLVARREFNPAGFSPLDTQLYGGLTIFPDYENLTSLSPDPEMDFWFSEGNALYYIIEDRVEIRHVALIPTSCGISAQLVSKMSVSEYKELHCLHADGRKRMFKTAFRNFLWRTGDRRYNQWTKLWRAFTLNKFVPIVEQDEISYAFLQNQGFDEVLDKIRNLENFEMIISLLGVAHSYYRGDLAAGSLFLATFASQVLRNTAVRELFRDLNLDYLGMVAQGPPKKGKLTDDTMFHKFSKILTALMGSKILGSFISVSAALAMMNEITKEMALSSSIFDDLITFARTFYERVVNAFEEGSIFKLFQPTTLTDFKVASRAVLFQRDFVFQALFRFNLEEQLETVDKLIDMANLLKSRKKFDSDLEATKLFTGLWDRKLELQALQAAKETMAEPLGIILLGQPGGGKSEFTDLITRYTCQHFKVPHTKGSCYQWAIFDKHQNHVGDPIVVEVNDFHGAPHSNTDENNMPDTLRRLIEPHPCWYPAASLEEKLNNFIRHKAVVVSSNDTTWDFTKLGNNWSKLKRRYRCIWKIDISNLPPGATFNRSPNGRIDWEYPEKIKYREQVMTFPGGKIQYRDTGREILGYENFVAYLVEHMQEYYDNPRIREPNGCPLNIEKMLHTPDIVKVCCKHERCPVALELGLVEPEPSEVFVVEEKPKIWEPLKNAFPTILFGKSYDDVQVAAKANRPFSPFYSTWNEKAESPKTRGLKAQGPLSSVAGVARNSYIWLDAAGYLAGYYAVSKTASFVSSTYSNIKSSATRMVANASDAYLRFMDRGDTIFDRTQRALEAFTETAIAFRYTAETSTVLTKIATALTVILTALAAMVTAKYIRDWLWPEGKFTNQAMKNPISLDGLRYGPLGTKFHDDVVAPESSTKGATYASYNYKPTFISPRADTTTYQSILDDCQNNTWNMVTDNGTLVGKVLLLRNDLLVCNYHVLKCAGWEEGQNRTIMLSKDLAQASDRTHVNLKDSYVLPDKDLAFIRTPTTQARDITGHFCSSTGNTIDGSIGGKDVKITVSEPYKGSVEGHYRNHEFLWAYNYQMAGLCGTPLVAKTFYGNSDHGYVLGIHSMGQLVHDVGYTVPIQQHHIANAINYLDLPIKARKVLFPEVHTDLGMVAQNNLLTVHEPFLEENGGHEVAIIPITVLGSTGKYERTDKSRVRHTALYKSCIGDMEKPKDIPPLHRKGEWMEEERYFGCPEAGKAKGYHFEPRDIRREEIDWAVRDLVGKNKPPRLHPLNPTQAIRGVAGDPFQKHVNLRSSVGLLKKFGYVPSDLYTLDEIDSDMLAEVERLIAACKAGEIRAEYTSWHLKDEATEVKKIRAHKFRYFMIGGKPRLIVDRMFLGPLIAYLYRNKDAFEAMGGFNPASPEFGEFVKKMRDRDFMFFADISGMDTSHRSFISDAVADFFVWLAKLAGYTEEEQMVVECLCKSMTFSVFELKGDIFATSEGMDSGKFLTFCFNCIVLSILYRCAWYRLYIMKVGPLANIPSFQDENYLVCGGDDSCLATNNREYTALHVAEVFRDYGYRMTPASKDSIPQPFDGEEEFVFLQRRPATVRGCIVGRLNLDSILKNLCFILPSKEISEHEQLMQKYDAAIRELALHEPEVFQKYAARIQEALPELEVKHQDWYLDKYFEGKLYDDAYGDFKVPVLM